MGATKRCPKCQIELKGGVPVCFVCGEAQPGFEGATQADRERYEEALAKADARPDRNKSILIGLIIGWVVVLMIMAIVVIFNQSTYGPGGPQH